RHRHKGWDGSHPWRRRSFRIARTPPPRRPEQPPMPHTSYRPSPCRRLLGLLGLGLALCGAPAAADDALADALAAGRLQAWQQLLEQGGDDERALLERINRFVNRSVQHGEDQDIWGQADYWATPLETLGRGRGD